MVGNMAAGEYTSDARRRARWTIAILLAVFLAPVAGGWAWFYFGDNFSLKNNGQLYEPARPVGDVDFRAADRPQAALADLRGNWLLLYVGQGACEDACIARLDEISRVRVSLGKNIKRVVPVYLADTTPDDSTLARIRAALPVGVVAGLADGGFDALGRTLARDGEDAAAVLRRVYLIDPIGNLVLSYEPDADPSGIRRDLARLLRVSQIG